MVEKPQDIILLIRLLINNNSAPYGGGIFVADETQRSVCGGGEDCFIQTIDIRYRFKF